MRRTKGHEFSYVRRKSPDSNENNRDKSKFAIPAAHTYRRLATTTRAPMRPRKPLLTKIPDTRLTR